MTVARVRITPAAAELVRRLRARHGPLLFHQSGGCCDGSAPMCYPRDEFRVGLQDVLLGIVEGCPVYIGAAQFDYWRHTQLTIDIVSGRGGGFSLEAPEGIRFLTRSRVFTDAEAAEPLDSGHAEAGARLSAEAGWNQTALDWRLMLQTGEAIGQLTADGELVASALILPYDGRGGSKVAWIAMVLTTGRWRRCGLATANLRWAIDRCRARGLIAGLDATPDGRLVYRPLGFRGAFGLCRFRCAAPAPAPVEASGITVRPMGSDDLAAATRLAAEAFGARRRQLVAYLRANQPDRAFVAEAGGGLVGMILARAGRVALHLGPLYAHSPEIGQR